MEKLTFIGGKTSVTGSMTLVETDKGKFLIDAGLYQGVESISNKNWDAFPFNPETLAAIILTHAHLDHSGMIPRLIKLGFRGTIYCTQPTMKLATLVMSDSARIMEDKKHPLYSFYKRDDVVIASSLFKTMPVAKTFPVLDTEITFFPVGHILGAVFVVLKGKKTFVFSGDIGRSDDFLMPPPLKCPPTDFLVMESTYGDRIRKNSIDADLTFFLKKIKNESSVGIIASFAIARSQLLITLILNYFESNPFEKIRFVVDGPMMVLANKIYTQFAQETKEPLLLKKALREIEVIQHEREWLSLKKKTGPLLAMSSSGMLSGGRIWRYLENWQNDKNACLFLPGYQADGTPGFELKEGRREIKDEKGNSLSWAGEVIFSSAFSSHADQNELLAWIKDLSPETQIYLNHGENNSKIKLQEKLNERGHHKVEINL